jgi:hypothetical protein
MLKKYAARTAWMILTTVALHAQAARAGVFDEADRLFQRRAEGSAVIAQSRAEYKRVLQNATGLDKGYAIQQIGRLAVYEGMYVYTDDQRAQRAATFGDCRTLAGTMSGDAQLRTYYAYWRLQCTALWMKYATVAERLARLGEVKRDFNEVVNDDLEVRPELMLDVRYMGGGIYRTLAGIYSNSLSNLMRDNLPNGSMALTMVDRALRSRPYPGDANEGASYYSNYRQKAEVLTYNRQTADARTVLDDAIEEIEALQEAEELPAGLEPETIGELGVMRSMTL